MFRIESKRQRPVGAHPVYWVSTRLAPPSDWTVKAVGELASAYKGKLPSITIERPTDRSKPYLLMEGLRGGTYIFTEETHLPSVSEVDTIVIADGSKSGFAIRGIAGVLGSTLLGFKVWKENNSGYFYHLLSSLYPLLASTTTGTAIPHLDQNLLFKLSIAIPNPDEQAAIARILDAVDTAIERTREAVSQATTLKRSLVQTVFSEGLRNQGQKKTRIGFIPESWEVKPIGSVVTEFEYGLSLPMSLKGTTPILRMGNIQGGEIIMDDLKYVTLPQNLLDRYLLKRGDVLFNRTNSQEWVGKVGIYRNDEPAVFASYLIRLHPDTTQIDNYYLGQLLNSYPAQCRIKRYATPGVQQVNINAKNLSKALLPIPVGVAGLEEQREIANLLEKADERIRNYSPFLIALQQLKKSLMHDLLTGKVRVDLSQGGFQVPASFFDPLPEDLLDAFEGG